MELPDLLGEKPSGKQKDKQNPLLGKKTLLACSLLWEMSYILEVSTSLMV
jgi:hypothetical protein